MPESPHCIEISHGLTEPRRKFSLRRDLSQIHGQSPTLDICQILKLHGTGSQKVSLKLLKGRNVSSLGLLYKTSYLQSRITRHVRRQVHMISNQEEQNQQKQTDDPCN